MFCKTDIIEDSCLFIYSEIIDYAVPTLMKN